MSPEELPDVLQTVNQLLELLISHFGPWGTIVIIFGALLLAVGLRLYNDWRKDKEVKALIDEKDRTIQRLAESERTYRALFLKEKAGWTDEQVERFIVRNEFANPAEAREALENQGDSQDEDL
jgi:hypothetical protein